MISSVLFLLAYAYYCFITVNGSKPLPWMVGNVAFLVGGAVMSFFLWPLYVVIGIAMAIGTVAYMGFAEKLSFSNNWMLYLKTAVSELCFWPVSMFELGYNKLSTLL